MKVAGKCPGQRTPAFEGRKLECCPEEERTRLGLAMSSSTKPDQNAHGACEAEKQGPALALFPG